MTDCANYKYDPLDRLVSEGETHGSGIACTDTKTTQFTFAGLTNQMTEEQQSSGGSLQTTKDYAYDIYGHRTTESVTPAGQGGTTYSFAYNVHDSVSMLLDPSGNTKASYGYRPYGDLDTALTGGEPDKNNPFNPYRYAAKRFDSGSQTIDMGARRFATDTSKFLQPDQFNGALANLSLGADALSQNRYSLADRDSDPVVERCERDGIAFIPWFPLAAGIGTLLGDAAIGPFHEADEDRRVAELESVYCSSAHDFKEERR